MHKCSKECDGQVEAVVPRLIGENLRIRLYVSFLGTVEFQMINEFEDQQQSKALHRERTLYNTFPRIEIA